MQMQVPIFFALNNLEGGGSDGIKVTWGGDKSKLPNDLQVDVQPKIRSLAMPVYPYELLRGDVTGSSEVSFIVDDQGRVASSRVVKADRPEFGLALQAAVERFEYEPAIKNGRPNKALLAFEQDFLSSSRDIVTGDEYRLLRLEQKHPDRIGKAGDLDSPVKAVVTRSPIFPRSLVGRATRGAALVELLIDEEGHPRLPRVVSASEPEFGYSAVEAASLWRFAPPTSKGKAVVTRARVPFVFDFSSAAPETGKPHPT
jgi:TonB family protein